MDSGNQIANFVVGFYTAFIAPLFDLMRDTDFLGVSLFNWLFGLTILSISVKFFRAFLGTNDDK